MNMERASGMDRISSSVRGARRNMCFVINVIDTLRLLDERGLHGG